MTSSSDAKGTMKAVRIHAFGGPEELRYEDAPRPAPKAGEVLIRIHASAVNPADWKVRSGLFGKDIPLTCTITSPQKQRRVDSLETYHGTSDV